MRLRGYVKQGKQHGRNFYAAFEILKLIGFERG